MHSYYWVTLTCKSVLFRVSLRFTIFHCLFFFLLCGKPVKSVNKSSNSISNVTRKLVFSLLFFQHIAWFVWIFWTRWRIFKLQNFFTFRYFFRWKETKRENKSTETDELLKKKNHFHFGNDGMFRCYVFSFLNQSVSFDFESTRISEPAVQPLNGYFDYYCLRKKQMRFIVTTRPNNRQHLSYRDLRVTWVVIIHGEFQIK